MRQGSVTERKGAGLLTRGSSKGDGGSTPPASALDDFGLGLLDSCGVRETRHLAARAARDLADWLAFKKAEGMADRSIYLYALTHAKFVIWRDRELADYTDGDINAYMAQAGSEQYRHHLASLFEWAYTTRRIPENPMMYVPKRRRRRKQKIIETFTDAEVLRLREADPLMVLLFDCGPRVMEAANWQRRDFSLTSAECSIRRGKGDKGRVVPLTEHAVSVIANLDLLERLDGNSDAYIWPHRYGGTSERLDRRTLCSEPTMRRWWQRTLELADVEYRPKSHPLGQLHNFHVARHTFATRYLRAGGKLERLSMLMGHASIQVTFDLYAHLDTKDLVGDIALLNAANDALVNV